ncbi:hypothetical protein TWF718_007938 [Orbilia javanica]|uniref:Uncharacterized protein n=1 Tax=Orbilia javanica TaxID=47235 RepID=A0AAN8MW41_9PEZI
MPPSSEYSSSDASEKTTDIVRYHQQHQPQIKPTQLLALIDKFCPYATEVAQRIRKASKEGLVVPQELVNIPDATTKLVSFLRNLKPAAGYFKPEFTEALYLRVLGMQRDYQGLSHNVDIWLSGQRAKKIVRFKPVNGSRLHPSSAHQDRGYPGRSYQDRSYQDRSYQDQRGQYPRTLHPNALQHGSHGPNSPYVVGVKALL